MHTYMGGGDLSEKIIIIGNGNDDPSSKSWRLFAYQFMLMPLGLIHLFSSQLLVNTSVDWIL